MEVIIHPGNADQKEFNSCPVASGFGAVGNTCRISSTLYVVCPT